MSKKREEKRVPVVEEYTSRIARGEVDPDEGMPREGIFTERQKLFVEAYTTSAAFGNARRSAEIAGYSIVGSATGHFILQRPHVAREIRRRLNAMYGTLPWALDELTSLATISADAFLTLQEDGTLRLDWEKAVANGALSAVKEVEVDPDTGAVKKVKLYDRLEALKTLLMAHGKIKQAGDGQVVINVQVNAMGPAEALPAAINAPEKIAEPMIETILNGQPLEEKHD